MTAEKMIRGLILGIVATVLIGAIIFVIVEMSGISVWVKGAFAVILGLVDVVSWSQFIA
jgi:hypothetical protein